MAFRASAVSVCVVGVPLAWEALGVQGETAAPAPPPPCTRLAHMLLGIAASGCVRCSIWPQEGTRGLGLRPPEADPAGKRLEEALATQGPVSHSGSAGLRF